MTFPGNLAAAVDENEKTIASFAFLNQKAIGRDMPPGGYAQRLPDFHVAEIAEKR